MTVLSAVLLLASSWTLLATSGAERVTWEFYSTTSSVPADSIVGGLQVLSGGVPNTHYVARVTINNSIVPATLTRYGAYWTAYAAWQGTSVITQSFEIAVADPKKVKWVPSTGGKVPNAAEPAGISVDGEPLYACRAFDDNRRAGDHVMMMTPGVLRPASGVCSIEFHGLNNYSTYEVLVVEP